MSRAISTRAGVRARTAATPLPGGYLKQSQLPLASLVFLAKPFDIEMLLMLVDDAVSSEEPPAVAL